MVDTEFLAEYNSSFYAGLPRLKSDDVTGAVMYALGTSELTQVCKIVFICLAPINGN